MQFLEVLAPVLGVILVFFLVRYLEGEGDHYTSRDLSMGVAIFGGALALVWLIVAPGVYFATLSSVAELEAFHDQTLASYEYTIDETRRIVLTDHALTDFSDQAVSERIAELRDRISWYNGNIAQFRKFEPIPMVGGIVADLPERLQPIVLD